MIFTPSICRERWTVWGGWGHLPQRMKLKELALKLKEAYRIPGLRMVGDGEREVSRVAVLGGSGGRYYPEAKALGADVYITGDLDHHTALDALADGLSLLDRAIMWSISCWTRSGQKLKENASPKKVPVQVTRWIPILSIIHKPIYTPIIACCFGRPRFDTI